MSRGALVLSFDFELAWGTRASSRRPTVVPGLERRAEVIERLLAILTRHDISATWATVGHLMVRSEDCVDDRFPYELPTPRFARFDGPWYAGVPPLGSYESQGYYAADLVQAVVDCAVYQELASHTFTHMLLDDPACSAELARGEFTLCQELADRWGQTLRSAVFPRNRVAHVEVLAELGYRCFRGANSEWYWFGRPATIDARRWLQLSTWPLRWLDERFCFCPPLLPVRQRFGLWEIPHSMFFPGRKGVSRWITPEQRTRRAVRGLQRAVELGRVFSLWTHPENYFTDPDRLLPALEAICAEAARLKSAGALDVLTMGQLAAELDAGRNLAWAEGSLPRAVGSHAK